jgi:hypothetical protein
MGACTSPSTPEPSYDPVPDPDLYQQVEALPGVRSADIAWDSSFTNGAVYSGTVRLDRSVDPVETLDEVTAILWQGRPNSSVILDVVTPRGTINNASIRLQDHIEIEERFGPQPGDGEVPPDAPPLPRPIPVR